MNTHIATPADDRYAAFLEKLPQKVRAVVDKLDEARDAQEQQHPKRNAWQRLAACMAELAPTVIDKHGPHAIRFYIPDGKYRLQVFALEQLPTSNVAAYVPEHLGLAVDAGILMTSEIANTYLIAGTTMSLPFQIINADTPNMAVCKPMLGWGRRALRIEVAADEREAVLRAVESLCKLAAKKWATPAPTA